MSPPNLRVMIRGAACLFLPPRPPPTAGDPDAGHRGSKLEGLGFGAGSRSGGIGLEEAWG